MRTASKIFALAVALGACGGGSESARPGKLGVHIENRYIDSVAMDQKQAVQAAQNAWSAAKNENSTAEAAFNSVSLTIVRNDRDKAKLELSSANSNKKSAEASADTNKINTATKELRSAELGVKAADARIRYFETYRTYLRQAWLAAEETMYWREAQYELAKAQLAQNNHIAPKGVAFDSFAKQEAERNKRATSAKSRVDADKTKAASARESWLKTQQMADQAKGTPSSFPDPMSGK